MTTGTNAITSPDRSQLEYKKDNSLNYSTDKRIFFLSEATNHNNP